MAPATGLGDARVIAIVAIAFDRVIGARSGLPWRLPEDLRRFKRTTIGHVVVMGRKTFASIGKPLPERTNIVVTRQAGFAAEGVLVARSPLEALQLGARASRQVFVIGGAEVYAATLDDAHEVRATLVYGAFEGDAFFPPLDAAWHLASREDSEGEGLRYSFVTLRRGAAPDGCVLCRLREGAPVPEETPWDAGLARALRDLARVPARPRA